MNSGFTVQLPFAVPNAAQLPSYTLTDQERLLANYPIEVMLAPNRGNVLTPAPNLQVASRFGGWLSKAKGANIVTGIGFEGGNEVVTFPGGSPSGYEPLRVQGYRVSGSYMVCMVVQIDADAVLTNPQQLFTAGIQGTGSATRIQIYTTNGYLYYRHGANQNVSAAGVIEAGGKYLIMATYDVAANKAKVYLNSLNPLPWSTGEALTGAAGSDDDLCFCSSWNANKSVGIAQTVDGKMAMAFAAREAWGAARYDEIRSSFLTLVASMFSDIALS